MEAWELGEAHLMRMFRFSIWSLSAFGCAPVPAVQVGKHVPAMSPWLVTTFRLMELSELKIQEGKIHD